MLSGRRYLLLALLSRTTSRGVSVDLKRLMCLLIRPTFRLVERSLVIEV